jgi:serine/threonine protein kinase
VPIDRWCDARNASLDERVTLFAQVLGAVQYAHRNLVVHRDLKPSNLLVDAQGRVKLLDFGIAKQLEGAELTATFDRALTFEYASPEQLHDAPITTATDIWQLGVVLHRLLSGAHPFGLTRDTPVAHQLQRLEREPEPLTRAAAPLIWANQRTTATGTVSPEIGKLPIAFVVSPPHSCSFSCRLMASFRVKCSAMNASAQRPSVRVCR